ncbi:DNA polymerase IV [Desulfocucumis palustris]|uniref:DNA polymerase IV n=1 Tax=Desulfocucumis palustris TaxID=1898651 RepID=A0A2L2XH13_9FIRM|nr:DNA polymerase IV [Desulfocucumis palustris]GBF35422.1 DNA polymerase IV [Desulfocucumis palustris]
MKRVILLADMNSFFASCHQAVQPELQGKEVIVAGDPQKRTGIVLAASYPAKALGVKTGMGIWDARKLCPHAHYFRPDYPLYMELSSMILGIMRDITDQIEPFSIDEAFADLTGVLHLWKTPEYIARALKERIRLEVGVYCSVGIGPNKLIAKMAAGLQKPDGLTILETAEDFKRIFWPQPVRKLFGIGPKYEKHLRRYNIRTIEDLANFPLEILKKRWGKNGETLWSCAHARDYSPVVPGSLDTSKSMGQQRTLPRDLKGFKEIKVVMLELSEMVARRVRQGGYLGRTVTLTLRDAQFCSLSRSRSMPYTNLADDIYHNVCLLLHRHWNESWPVRLVGVSLDKLTRCGAIQYDIFGQKSRRLELALACDKIRDRFGEKAITRGVSLMEVSVFGQQR